uniref:Dolichyl-diphosphooligosaccharide--protein glycosyltransferase subunit 2 n=2 Tax=Elaeis guineensis var. tenera TaxID=51953 RepID=A0A8N4F2K8_ELAGV
MARNLRLLGFLALICASLSISGAAVIRPINDAHRSAALELFVPTNGSFGSLEEAYEALRTFQIFGVEKSTEISHATCPVVAEKLGSSSFISKDLFLALRVNSILGCQIDARTFEDVASKLQAVIKNASSLVDFHYGVEGLLHIKDQGISVALSDADGTFHSIKALSQSDGRWRYDSNSAESSTYAAGIALETLAGVVSLA